MSTPHCRRTIRSTMSAGASATFPGRCTARRRARTRTRRRAARSFGDVDPPADHLVQIDHHAFDVVGFELAAGRHDHDSPVGPEHPARLAQRGRRVADEVEHPARRAPCPPIRYRIGSRVTSPRTTIGPSRSDRVVEHRRRQVRPDDGSAEASRSGLAIAPVPIPISSTGTGPDSAARPSPQTASPARAHPEWRRRWTATLSNEIDSPAVTTAIMARCRSTASPTRVRPRGRHLRARPARRTRPTASPGSPSTSTSPPGRTVARPRGRHRQAHPAARAARRRPRRGRTRRRDAGDPARAPARACPLVSLDRRSAPVRGRRRSTRSPSPRRSTGSTPTAAFAEAAPGPAARAADSGSCGTRVTGRVPHVDALWSIMDRVEKRAPWREHEQWHDSAFTETPYFGPLHEATFHHEQADDASTRSSTAFRSVSHVAVLPPARAGAVLDEVRDLLAHAPRHRGRERVPDPLPGRRVLVPDGVDAATPHGPHRAALAAGRAPAGPPGSPAAAPARRSAAGSCSRSRPTCSPSVAGDRVTHRLGHQREDHDHRACSPMRSPRCGRHRRDQPHRRQHAGGRGRRARPRPHPPTDRRARGRRAVGCPLVVDPLRRASCSCSATSPATSSTATARSAASATAGGPCAEAHPGPRGRGERVGPARRVGRASPARTYLGRARRAVARPTRPPARSAGAAASGRDDGFDCAAAGSDSLTPRTDSTATRSHPAPPGCALDLALPGDWNRMNAASALTAAVAHFGVDARDRGARAASVRGRCRAGSRPTASPTAGRRAVLLAKNPAGWTEVLAWLEQQRPSVVLAVNAHVADGRDPSWLWDVPFELLRGQGTVAASGERALDVAVRLDYGGVDCTRVEPDPIAAAARARRAPRSTSSRRTRSSPHLTRGLAGERESGGPRRARLPRAARHVRRPGQRGGARRALPAARHRRRARGGPRAGAPLPDALDVYLFGGGEDDPQVMAATRMRESAGAIDRGPHRRARWCSRCARASSCSARPTRRATATCSTGSASSISNTAPATVV